MNYKTFLRDQLAGPLSRRAGTALGAFLVGQGVAGDTSSAIETGVVAALLLIADLILSAANKAKGKK